MTQLLHEWVSRQAELRPDAPAVIALDERVTYGRLDALSNQLARALKDAGCRKGDRVCLLMPMSPAALAGVLGVYKADCVLVPLDPSCPVAHLAKICDACEPRVILAAGQSASTLGQLLDDAALRASSAVGWLGTDRPATGAVGEHFSLDEVRGYSTTPPEFGNTRHDPAHILFRTGSIGRPRGIVITHANVIHFVEWASRYFGLSASDRISGDSPLHVDLSSFDIFATFAAGAQLHLVPPELNRLPERVAEFIRTSKLTQWFCAPPILIDLAKSDAVPHRDFPELKRLVWCGDVLPTPALVYWMTRLPHVTFSRLYGRTEATIASSVYTVSEPPTDPNADIPIGTECDGEELLVLNDRLQPVPFGEVGDLYIRGVGLSPGYWRDSEGTSAAFLPRPAAFNPADRLFKTGDLARVGEEDGLVYFLGRQLPSLDTPQPVNA